MAGCCKISELPLSAMKGISEEPAALYTFRLEQSQANRFSGLLATKPRENGMWSVLLDATGVPLIKMLVKANGAKQVEHCAAAVCDTRLPALLGNLVDYMYFMPASSECPWYALTCICQETDALNRSIKWKRIGPLHLWELERPAIAGKNEKITLHLGLSSITVHLQRIDNPEK